MRRRLVQIALLTVAAACSSDDPAAVELTGTWVGTYTHPTIPGSLTLTITSTDDDFEGAFLLTYQIGLGPVQNITGNVIGDRPSATAVEFTIDASGFDWMFVGALTNANRIQGTWESLAAPGIQGAFDLQRD